MEARFRKHFIVNAETGCWDWIASKDVDGYGLFWLNKRHRAAHRVAYELWHGPIATGLVVRHKCRNKCVNPNHLEIGTRAENNKDMVRDGTATGGRKLTREQVEAIITRQTESRSALATEFNVCVQHINLLIRRGGWKSSA